jgi:hypothetical protein
VRCLTCTVTDIISITIIISNVMLVTNRHKSTEERQFHTTCRAAKSAQCVLANPCIPGCSTDTHVFNKQFGAFAAAAVGLQPHLHSVS